MFRELPDLETLKKGDDGEWTKAFKDLWPLALRAAQHPEARLSLEEAEEVASEALGHLVARVHTVSTGEQLKALVCTIAHRRAISLARRKSAAKRGQTPLSLEALASEGAEPPDVPCDANGQLPEVEFREMVILLHFALNGLDEETRSLLHDKIGLGLSYEQLARKRRMPIGTVCAKVARGLRKLRQQLDQSPELLNELKGFLR